MLGLDAYFRTYLLSDYQEVTHVGVLMCVCVFVYVREVEGQSESMV